MRLILPLIAFAMAALFDWAMAGDGSMLAAALSPSAQHNIRLLTGVLFWLSGAWASTAALAVLIRHWAAGPGAQSSLPRLLIDVAAILIFGATLLVIISHVFGLPLTGIVATSGVLAAVIGLAVQKIIADVFAGIALNIDQAVRLGDWIETVGGAVGEVKEINWRATRLLTLEGRTIMLPNSTLVANQFTNLSAPFPHFRQRKTITVANTVPPERVVAILQAAMEATEGVLERPKPLVTIEEHNINGVVYGANFWVPNYRQMPVISREVSINLLKFLDQAGYSPANARHDISMMAEPHQHIERRLDVEAILARAPLFQAFDAAALQELAALVRPQEVAAGTAIIREGAAGASLFVIVSGLLDIMAPANGGAARQLARLGPGELVGEMSLLTGTARRNTVIAATPATLIEIGKAQLEPLLARSPDIIAALSRLQADRLAHSDSVAASLSVEEQQIVKSVGMAGFLRERIARFFGKPAV